MFNLFTQKWRFLSPLLVLLCLSTSVQATNGLESLANVNGITQDKQGFIWLAGQQGLTRFDGKHSINFSASNQQWPIPFKWSHDVSLADDKLLVGTENNKLWVFDPTTGKATAIIIKNKKNSIYQVISFLGKYYIYEPGAVYQYDPANLTTTLIKNNILVNQFAHTDKYLYIATNSGLYQLQNGKLKQIIKQSIKAITAFKDQIIAINQKNIYSYHDNGQQKQIETNTPLLAITKAQNSKTFFVITNQGTLKKYDPVDLTQLDHNYPKTSHVRARRIFQDKSEVIWVISSLGVSRISEINFKNYHIVYDIDNNSNEIEIFNKQLIIGSYGQGLKNFDKSHPVFPTGINKNFTANGRRITDLLAIKDNLYIATFDGLWLYQSKTQQLTKVDFANNDKLLLRLHHKNNLLYLASNYNGLYIYDLVQQKIIHHTNVQQGISDNEVIDILPLDNQNIWLSTATGIDIYYPNSNSVKNIPLTVNSKIISLSLADNKIFAATKADGIFVFNRQGELLFRFANGLDFSYMNLYNNVLWAPTREGLYQINPHNYQIDLLPNTQVFSFIGEPLPLNNKIYAAHFSGVLEVPLTIPSTYNSNVLISKTTISGKQYLLNKSIEVASANDVITLELASLDYRDGQEKQFKYRINNGVWNLVNNNQLTLTGLASGIYNIEIMATNSLGQWSNNRAYTEIKVAYPWYWTPQIRLIYLFLFLISLAFTAWLLYLRTKSISRIHYLLAEDIKSRGKTALNVTHNLSLALEHIKVEGNDHDLLNKLLKQSIDELNSSSQNQEPDTFYGQSLSVALNYLSEYIHRKYHTNLTIHLEITEDSVNNDLKADLYKIIYEAVISATLNGDGRNFSVSIKAYKNKLWLNIQDDGSSFSNFKNKINFDIAMYYIRQIAKKYHATVNTYNEDVDGSQLLIGIPQFDKFIENSN
ncbi:MAG: hypothetical protein COB35_08775 [Gammaproteobacteria bacterium]|nr:MAG: hypothetical protein COB35_08775 [Gammaproteobacteria bacterium]